MCSCDVDLSSTRRWPHACSSIALITPVAMASSPIINTNHTMWIFFAPSLLLAVVTLSSSHTSTTWRESPCKLVCNSHCRPLTHRQYGVNLRVNSFMIGTIRYPGCTDRVPMSHPESPDTAVESATDSSSTKPSSAAGEQPNVTSFVMHSHNIAQCAS